MACCEKYLLLPLQLHKLPFVFITKRTKRRAPRDWSWHIIRRNKSASVKTNFFINNLPRLRTILDFFKIINIFVAFKFRC